MKVICAACGIEVDEKDMLASAGPYGASWYCRETGPCRERYEAVWRK